ncbi:MAG: hypothetical protein SFW36_20165 [Leptolyngbyaceae cyanobacterium bins.59]|nr:hypothetical protein [Leptolyngbyaceae cyanobacterium bins.59]
MSQSVFLAGLTAIGVLGSPTLSVASPAKPLHPTQVNLLKEVGISIVVPTYIPKGFSLSKLSTEPCQPNTPRKNGVCQTRSGYRLLYRNSENTCFAVYGNFTRGIGGGGSGFSFPVTTKILGKTFISFGRSTNYEDKVPSEKQLNSVQQNIWSFPIYQKGTPIIYGIRTIENEEDCWENRSLTPLEMAKIFESLGWLSRL